MHNGGEGTRLRLFHEPLVHFLIIGATVSGFYSFLNPGDADPSQRTIVVTPSDIQWLNNTWKRQWQRQPTDQELNGLIDAHVREQILYREALALGLDEDDLIVRRRLAQKVAFLIEDLASPVHTPSDTELALFFDREREQYRVPAKLSFSHFFFSIDLRGSLAADDAKQALEKMRVDQEGLTGTNLGDAFLAGQSFFDTPETEVEHIFGSGFVRDLAGMKAGHWAGPILSGYGWHLVKVESRMDSRVPALREIEDRIRSDWMDHEHRKANDEVFNRLRARYRVVIETAAPSAPSGSAVAQVTENGVQ